MCAVAQEAGKVLTETLLLSGTGYTTGTLDVDVIGGTGVQMSVDITTAGPVGPVTGVVLNNPGSGYTAGDVVTITGGGADATVTINTVEKDGLVITDKTAEAISKSGSSFVSFPTTNNGDVIYLGSLRKDVSSNPLKFYGIETLVATGAVGNIDDYVFEIADGHGNWKVINAMGTSAEEGYPYGKSFFKRTGIKEFYRLGITNTTSYTPADFYKVVEFDWTPNLITLDSGTFPNGLTSATAYWLRIRTTRSVSAPTLLYPSIVLLIFLKMVFHQAQV